MAPIGDTPSAVFGSTFGSDVSCSDLNSTADKQITVRDQSGTVIGTTTSVETYASPVATAAGYLVSICAVASSYSVEVPRADFYTIEVQGADPAAPISFTDLETADFNYYLTLPR